jgi:CRISPR-associated protein Cmr2
VPVGAEGTFSLLYAPLPGTVSDEEQEKQAREDLVTVARAVKAMLLTYGFSAKKSSGYGEAQDEIEGTIHTTKGNYQLTSLAKLAEEARHVTWS